MTPVELAVARAIHHRRDADERITVKLLAADTGHPVAEVSKAVSRLRLTGRLPLAGWTLSGSTVAELLVGQLRQTVVEPVLVAPDAVVVESTPEPAAVPAAVEPAVQPAPAAAPEPAPEPPPLAEPAASGVRPVAGLPLSQIKVLAYLTRIAEAGGAAPSHRMIGTAAHVAIGNVSYLLTRLQSAEKIRAERRASDLCHRYVIIAAGPDGCDICTGWSEMARGARVIQIDQRGPDGSVTSAAAIAERRAADEAARDAELAAMRRAADKPATRAGIGVQMIALDRAGAATAMLREAWPEVHALLGRIATETHQRPIPVIARLIREEAARLGICSNMGAS